jgi:pilus assembly protein CpaF
MAGMIANGTMTPAMGRLLEIAGRSRLNVLVSGGTGSGKTTLLNAMSQFIDHSERVVTIEDAAELQLQQPHVISLETRPPSLEGTGQVTQRDLLWNALRMRPDRIVVGEVRGPEAFDMLQAMNTGHDGSISTVHANSTRDALTRVENMVQMGQVNLPSRAIRSQIVAALDIIVQVERMRDGQRRIIQITEVTGLEGEVITTNDIAAFEYKEEDVHGRIFGTYRSTHAVPKFKSRLSYFGLDRAWADAMREL